jgi:hypothetical protein
MESLRSGICMVNRSSVIQFCIFFIGLSSIQPSFAQQKLDRLLIRIRVNPKQDENTAADLEEDIRGYRTQYPTVQFKNLAVRNPTYQCWARVFYVPGEFYEYVTYVNPGPNKLVLFSVSMNSQKSEATTKELEAYKSAVQSLTLLKP